MLIASKSDTLDCDLVKKVANFSLVTPASIFVWLP